MGWVHGGAGATGRTTGESACPSQHCTDHPRGVPSGGGRDGPWADSGVGGAEVDGLGDVEDVAADVRARTSVALVAVVARDRGSRLVMVAVVPRWE